MGIIRGAPRVPEAERAFAQALDAYERLRECALEPAGYLAALTGIIGRCQETIGFDRQYGDAYVLLANAFYLLHLATYPATANTLPLRLAAATVQHWCDQPVGQLPWTEGVDRGCRIYELIAQALIEILPDCADCEEREMRYLEAELFRQALVASPHDWMTAGSAVGA